MGKKLVCVVFLLVINTLSAKEFPIRILSREVGLEKANYISVMQDKAGFLWFSSQTGLYQYSGSYTKKYVPGQEWGDKLTAEFFYKSLEDQSGTLWLATRNGLYSLSASRKQIQGFWHKKDDEYSIPNNRIFNMSWYNDSLLFLACDRSGITVFNIKTKQARAVQPVSKGTGNLSGNIWIRQYYMFSDSVVFVRTAQGYLCFNPVANTLVRLEDQLPGIKGIEGLSNLFIDRQQTVWFSDSQGRVFRYSPEGKLDRVKDSVLCYYVQKSTTNFFEFDDDKLLISTTEKHFLLDRITLDIHELTFRNYHDIPLTGNLITACIRLKDDNVFVTFRNGLVGQIDTKSRFRYIRFQPASEEPINLSHILDDTAYGKRYISNYHDSSFFVEDLNSGAVNRIPKISFGGISANRILMDQSGRIWACQNKGVVQIDRKTQRLTFFSPDTAASTLFEMEEIRPGVFVVGSFQQGLFLFEPDRNIFRKVPETNGWIRTQVFSLKYDPSHDVLWIGTVRNGLFRYDIGNEQFTRYMPDPENPQSLGGDWVRSLAISPDGYLWMTADPGGLCRFDYNAPKGKEFITLSINQGLPSNHISGLGVDASGRIWITSLNGLATLDTDSLSVKRWEVDYGMYDNGFHYANLSVNARNEILIGTERGYLSFYPDSLRMNHSPPTVVLTDFTVMNNQMRSIESHHNQESVRLKHNENYFSIEFAVVNFTEPQRNTVYYTLEGAHESWQSIQQSGKIYFTNVHPGDYVFRLKARNADGVWSHNEIIVPLVISPPFWKTNWFLAIVLFLVVSLIYLAFKLRLRQLLRESRLQSEKLMLKSELEAKLASLEMTALRAQMNPHFIFNCLNSINRFIIVSDNETASEYLTKFSRLIRLVLDNSRAEQITLERELETLRLYIEMEKLRFVDRFDCSISIDEQIPVSQTYIQPMLVQPYVENAIWHGLMHLKQGGLLDIRMQLINDQLVVSIIDNGIGRQKSMSMKSVQMISNSSHGMKVTAERLALLNSKMDAQARVVITDLSDELNQPAGTIVELFLPFDQNFHAQNTIQQNLVQ